MTLCAVPSDFNPRGEITPPAYGDHYLFTGGAAACPEFPAAAGLLLTGTYMVNGARQTIAKGEVFFVNRGSRLAVKGGAPVMLFFHNKFADLVMFSMQYGEEASDDTLPYDFSYLERTHMDVTLFDTVSALVPLGSSCSSFAALETDMIIRALFEDLLRKNQEAYTRSQNIHAIKPSTRLEVFKRISAARDWMEANFHADVTLERTAAVASMNSQHFLRMFKQVYQVTPHQFVIDLKLRRALALLESTALTINEICAEIGFESAFSFSVLFKKRFGQAPSHFREGGPGTRAQGGA